MRTSLNRERATTETPLTPGSDEYIFAITQAFDELLERVGGRGTRFQSWCNQLSEKLESATHDVFCLGIKELGPLLGYDSRRPKHQASTDCRWKGTFGVSKEVFTIEAKIDDVDSASIIASDVGQAHNQFQRAKAEYEHLGYSVRGIIVSHIIDIDPAAQSSIGDIRVLTKDSVVQLWEIVKQLLTEYRNEWSIDNIGMRRSAGDAIRPKIPNSGWLGRALVSDQHVISGDVLLSEWKQS